MLTTKQINWAKQHDWYIATIPIGIILVDDRHSDGFEATLRFDDFEELRTWAGY